MHTPFEPHELAAHEFCRSHSSPVKPEAHSQRNWKKGRSTQAARFWQGLDEQALGALKLVSQLSVFKLKTRPAGQLITSLAPLAWQRTNKLGLVG